MLSVKLCFTFMWPLTQLLEYRISYLEIDDMFQPIRSSSGSAMPYAQHNELFCIFYYLTETIEKVKCQLFMLTDLNSTVISSELM
jgi:hypothetical protein